MAEQLLDGADIVAGFKKVGGKTVAKGMATGGFWYASGVNSLLDRVLQVFFVHMMAACVSRARVDGEFSCRKDPLPAPVGRGFGIFSF